MWFLNDLIFFSVSKNAIFSNVSKNIIENLTKDKKLKKRLTFSFKLVKSIAICYSWQIFFTRRTVILFAIYNFEHFYNTTKRDNKKKKILETLVDSRAMKTGNYSSNKTGSCWIYAQMFFFFFFFLLQSFTVMKFGKRDICLMIFNILRHYLSKTKFVHLRVSKFLSSSSEISHFSKLLGISIVFQTIKLFCDA